MPWTVACQASLSMEFSRQEYGNGLPFPSPGDLPNPGMEPGSPALQADALSSEPPGNPTKHLRNIPGEKQCCQKTMHSVMSDSLWPHGLQPARLLCLWNFPGKNTGVGCHFLLQGIFPTQGLNPGLLHWRQALYCLSHQGSHCLHNEIIF